jgi:ribose-phosphate pyrophosphokinase
VLGATDAGRAKWVQSLATRLDVEPAFVYKRRDPTSGQLAVTGVNADVKGREVVIYDDMIRTGSSLLQAGRAYLGAGATRVHAIASHLVLPGDSLERMRSSGVLASIHGTNSHPGCQKLADVPGAVSSIAELMAEALDRS